jgi:3-oxoacyl-[acyl-carrier-protein] synthase III
LKPQKALGFLFSISIIMVGSVIVGTGSYIPDHVVTNKAFENNQFYEADGSKLYKKNESVLKKFSEITGIHERRYAGADQTCSDLAFLSAVDAFNTSEIDRETLDYIIVAHNFGDVASQSNRTSLVPSLASRVKAMLKIENPDCVAYDIIFGCPGWIEGVIQADCFIRSGMAKRCMVIGAETLSRMIDPHDRDSMIYADGSGAVILEASTAQKGILSHKTRTYATDHSHLLRMDASYAGFTGDENDRFLKMNGRKVYEFALTNVPLVMKETIEKANLRLKDISKVLVHQANDKMDQAILQRLFHLFDQDVIPQGIMPMTIGALGNSSVATVPTLLDLTLKGKLDGQKVDDGDHVLFASVGAGMNINALVYRF